MSIAILIIVITAVVMGLLYAVTPRGLDHYQDVVRVPVRRDEKPR